MTLFPYTTLFRSATGSHISPTLCRDETHQVPSLTTELPYTLHRAFLSVRALQLQALTSHLPCDLPLAQTSYPRPFPHHNTTTRPSSRVSRAPRARNHPLKSQKRKGEGREEGEEKRRRKKTPQGKRSPSLPADLTTSLPYKPVRVTHPTALPDLLLAQGRSGPFPRTGVTPYEASPSQRVPPGSPHTAGLYLQR